MELLSHLMEQFAETFLLTRKAAVTKSSEKRTRAKQWILCQLAFNKLLNFVVTEQTPLRLLKFRLRINQFLKLVSQVVAPQRPSFDMRQDSTNRSDVERHQCPAQQRLKPCVARKLVRTQSVSRHSAAGYDRQQSRVSKRVPCGFEISANRAKIDV
jgi:hypothetical protein